MTSVNQEIRELRSEVSQLAKMMKNGAKNANGAAQHTLESMTDALGFDTDDIKRMANKAGKSVRHFVDDNTKRATEAQENFEESVTSHPYKALLTAAIGGVLMGAFLNRK